jgi:hypothetical protein
MGAYFRLAVSRLSSPGTRAWFRQPEHKLVDPGDPVIAALKRFAGACGYWMPAFAGMTSGKSAPELDRLAPAPL